MTAPCPDCGASIGPNHAGEHHGPLCLLYRPRPLAVVDLSPEELIVLGVLRRNWWRISRYENPDDAVGALANVAREVCRAVR